LGKWFSYTRYKWSSSSN